MVVSLELKGIGAARFAIAQAVALQRGVDALAYAQHRWPHSPSVAQAFVVKTAVAGATPGTAGWASEFVDNSIAADFLEAVRPMTVVDRLPFARKIPFTHPVPAEATAGFGGAWYGEGGPLPSGAGNLTSVTCPRTTAGVIAVLTMEARDLLLPSHERMVRDVMLKATTAYLDAQFLDPSVTVSAETRPASITNGSTEITSTGATAAAILADLRNMLGAVNADLVNPLWVMRRRDAIYLAGLMGANGGLQFPNAPREVLGIPVLVSSAVPAAAGSPPEDRYVVLLDQDSVCIADEGRVNIRASDKADVQMVDNPTGNAGTGTSTSVVSMFQTHSTALRVSREISWARAHAAGVAYMQVSW